MDITRLHQHFLDIFSSLGSAHASKNLKRHKITILRKQHEKRTNKETLLVFLIAFEDVINVQINAMLLLLWILVKCKLPNSMNVLDGVSDLTTQLFLVKFNLIAPDRATKISK